MSQVWRRFLKRAMSGSYDIKRWPKLMVYSWIMSTLHPINSYLSWRCTILTYPCNAWLLHCQEHWQWDLDSQKTYQCKEIPQFRDKLQNGEVTENKIQYCCQHLGIKMPAWVVRRTKATDEKITLSKWQLSSYFNSNSQRPYLKADNREWKILTGDARENVRIPRELVGVGREHSRTFLREVMSTRRTEPILKEFIFNFNHKLYLCVDGDPHGHLKTNNTSWWKSAMVRYHRRVFSKTLT